MPPARPPRLLDPQWRPLIAGILAVVTLAAFEAVGTSTAMPIVAEDLDAVGSYTWAFTAYILASLLAMVVAGIDSDARGPRRSIAVGITSLGLGSVICGFSNALPLLIVGRAIQGIGGGAVIVGVYVVIARAFPEELRPKAFSLLAAAWIVPSIVGPLIAGWLADSVSWRWVFWIIPIFVIPPALILLPRIKHLGGGDPITGGARRVRAGLLVSLGLFAVQFGVDQLNVIGTALAVAGAVLVVFACGPLFPPGARRLARGLPTTVIIRGFVAAAYFSAEIFIPLALLQERGVSATIAGLALALSAVGWALGSFTQGRLAGDVDRSKYVRTGSLLVAVSSVVTSLVLLPSIPVWFASISWAVASFGMGLAVPSISVQTMRLSPVGDQGRNSAGLQIADSTFVVIVTAALGVIHASAVRAGTVGPMTYAVLWCSAAGIAAITALVAGRMSPKLLMDTAK